MNHNDEAILLDNILVSDAASRLGILTDYFKKKDFFSPSMEKVKNWEGGIDLIESSYSVKSFMDLKDSFSFQMVELEKITDLAKAYLYVLPRQFYKKEKNFWGELQSGVIDYTNNKYGKHAITIASAGIHKGWKMRREHSSKIDTASFDYLPKVSAS